MVTTPEEYYSKLNIILNENPPIYALLPSAENIYNIDLNSRTIDAPKFIGVSRDHKSETIYFIIDRYNDYMDLAQTCCIITYINANKEARQYMVPFYDIYTYAHENKMLIPWNIGAPVVAAAGTVTFSIQFFKVGEVYNEEKGTVEKVLTYNLNTLPATTTVKNGIDITKLESDYPIWADPLEEILDRINDISNYQTLYWTILD